MIEYFLDPLYFVFGVLLLLPGLFCLVIALRIFRTRTGNPIVMAGAAVVLLALSGWMFALSPVF